MKPRVIILVTGFFCLVAALQFVPVNRTNPPEREAVVAPSDVQAILQRACYDCHSNDTRWP